MLDSPVRSQRLDLIALTPELYEATLRADRAAVERDLGAAVDEAWFDVKSLCLMRLNQLRIDSSLQPWLLRGIVLRSERLVIGRIGFHTSPDPGYLKDFGPGVVEFGYAIFPQWRRQGYASEAVEALMRWAAEAHAVRRFILSISPNNVPSLALARRFGFVRVGEQVDEQDGVEHIFLLDRGGDDNHHARL